MRFRIWRAICVDKSAVIKTTLCVRDVFLESTSSFVGLYAFPIIRKTRRIEMQHNIYTTLIHILVYIRSNILYITYMMMMMMMYDVKRAVIYKYTIYMKEETNSVYKHTAAL